MKKIPLVLLLIIIFVLSMFITPSILTAGPAPFFEGNYYDTVMGNISWTDARDLANTYSFKLDPSGPTYWGHLVTINSSSEEGFIEGTFSGGGNNYWIGAYQTGDNEPAGGWKWVTGEKWGQYTNWGGGEPNNDGGDENYAEFRSSTNSWNDVTNNDIFVTGFIIEYEIKHKSTATESIPVWVRNIPMTCYQVWINEDNKFEMVFWYPYRDNNWVRIYDMAGNIVYEIDMPYDNPNIIVDLPDGMYTVKTFTVGNTEPIQTFVIGK